MIQIKDLGMIEKLSYEKLSYLDLIPIMVSNKIVGFIKNGIIKLKYKIIYDPPFECLVLTDDEFSELKLQKDFIDIDKHYIFVGFDRGSERHGISIVLADKENLSLIKIINLQIDARQCTSNRNRPKKNRENKPRENQKMVKRKKTKTVKRKKTQKMLRRNRRNLNTPYRSNNFYKKSENAGISPVAKSTNDFIYNILLKINRFFPIDIFVYEDYQARTIEGTNKTKNKTTASMQNNKNYLFSKLEENFNFPTIIITGNITKQIRDEYSLYKDPDIEHKLEENFSIHCVDSFSLALFGMERLAFEKKVKPPYNQEYIEKFLQNDNNKKITILSYDDHNKRSLHKQEKSAGGIRGKTSGGSKKGDYRRNDIVIYKNDLYRIVGYMPKNGYEVKKLDGKNKIRDPGKTPEKIIKTAGWAIQLYVKKENFKFLCHNRYDIIYNV